MRILGLALAALLLVACGQPAARVQHSPIPAAPPGGWPQPPVPPTSEPVPTPVPVVANPARMLIPSINLNAAIEHVGFLDIPRDPADVAWFNKAPGDAGTATFDGHLDWIGFKPAVFWDLGKLKAGDEIDILGADGTQQRWVVDFTQSVPYTSTPPDWLYAQSGPPRISLITCDGSWTGSIYSDRLLVRAVPPPRERPDNPARY